MTANAIPLAVCQWLKEKGIAQNGPHWWVGHVWDKTSTEMDWRVELGPVTIYERRMWHSNLHTLAIAKVSIPPLLSPDPAHPEYGALGFLETLGWYWCRADSGEYFAFQYTSPAKPEIPNWLRSKAWLANRETTDGAFTDPIVLIEAVMARYQATEVV